MGYGNNFTKKIYDFSPPLVKNTFATVFGYKQRLERYGKIYKKYKVLLNETQYWTKEDLLSYRDEKTVKFINYIIENNEYYNKSPNYSKINSVSELVNFPVINKQIVRANLEKLKSNKISISHRMAHTSGTSGSSIIFPISNYCFQREYAFRWMHYQWGNVSLDGKDRVAVCSGHPVAYNMRKKPPFWVYDYANNWLFFSSYHMTKENLNSYIKELNKFQPKLLHGYPSSVYLLALTNLNLGSNKVSIPKVYCASETLFDWQRRVIEESFNGQVFNWYGNSEMCANIVQCERGELHLKYEHSYVEILNDKNENCSFGDTGRLVCTGFGNYVFPLIRYDIVDLVTLSSKLECKCKRGGQIINKIEGRKEDYILTPDGRIVGRLDHLFKDALNVEAAQIIQNKIEEIILRLKINSKYSKIDEAAIIKEARLRLGEEIKILFEYVEEIERTKNGKFKFIVSNLEKEKIKL